MRGLLRAVLFFLLGSFFSLSLFVAVKLFLIHCLGDSLKRLPDLQMERFREIADRKPMIKERLFIFGDSTTTFSIDPKAFTEADSLSAVNSTTVEAYYILKRIFDSGANPRCVLASFSFTWSLNRNFFWTMFVGSGFFTPTQLEEIYAVSKAFGERPGKFPPIVRTLLRLAAQYGGYDDNTWSRIQYAFFSSPFERVRVNAFRQALWINRGSAALKDTSRFEGSLEMTYAEDPKMNRTEEEYFRRILLLLKEHSVKLYLVKIPFAQTVPTNLAEDFWKKYDALLSRMGAGPNSDVTHLNPAPLPESHYISAGHLNRTGIGEMNHVLAKSVASCFR